MKINANYRKMIKSDVRTGITVRRRILPIYLRHCNIIVKYIMDSYNLILNPAYKCSSLLGLASKGFEKRTPTLALTAWVSRTGGGLCETCDFPNIPCWCIPVTCSGYFGMSG
jgi:hypothetical protein